MNPPARSSQLIGILIRSTGFVLAKESQAIPAFAREYGISCGTCPTVYPALNSHNTHDPEDEFRREQSSFELSSVEILAGASLGDHLSFFMDAPLAELEQRP